VRTKCGLVGSLSRWLLARQVVVPFPPPCRVTDIHFHARDALCIARHGNGGKDIIASPGIPGPEQFETGGVKLFRAPLALDSVHLVFGAGNDKINLPVISQPPVLNLRLVCMGLKIFEDNVLPQGTVVVLPQGIPPPRKAH